MAWYELAWQQIQSFSSSFFPTNVLSSYVPQFIKDWYQQAKDSYHIVTQKDAFIFNELTQRSLSNDAGYAKVDVGLFGFRLASVLVVTGKDQIQRATDYGNWTKRDPQRYDTKARQPFDRFIKLVGSASIVNKSDESVAAEHSALKHYINRADAIQFTQRTIDQMFEAWSPHEDAKSQLRTCAMRVVAKIMLGIESIPDELTLLIGEAEHALINFETFPKAELDRISKRLRAISDATVETQYDDIKHSENFIRAYLKSDDMDAIKQINPLGSLIVEGNLTTLMVGALLMANQHPEHLAELKQALSTDKSMTMNTAFDHPCLHQFYLECLRYFSPNPPIARFISKDGVLKGRDWEIPVQANTHMFVPTRSIMHAKQLWDQPEQFNPKRHDDASKVNYYPLVPFSIGTRICPASKAIIEHMIKYLVLQSLKSFPFDVDKPLETVPIGTKSPRFQQAYFLRPKAEQSAFLLTSPKASPPLTTAAHHQDKIQQAQAKRRNKWGM